MVRSFAVRRLSWLFPDGSPPHICDHTPQPNATPSSSCPTLNPLFAENAPPPGLSKRRTSLTLLSSMPPNPNRIPDGRAILMKPKALHSPSSRRELQSMKPARVVAILNFRTTRCNSDLQTKAKLSSTSACNAATSFLKITKHRNTPKKKSLLHFQCCVLIMMMMPNA